MRFLYFRYMHGTKYNFSLIFLSVQLYYIFGKNSSCTALVLPRQYNSISLVNQYKMSSVLWCLSHLKIILPYISTLSWILMYNVQFYYLPFLFTAQSALELEIYYGCAHPGRKKLFPGLPLAQSTKTETSCFDWEMSEDICG